MFFKRKKTGFAVDGARLDEALPDGPWSDHALMFHKQVSRVVATILADDEALLAPTPVVEPGATTFKPNWIDRADTETGCRFRTDTEGEGRYRLRYSSVRKAMTAQQNRDYRTLFETWVAHHVSSGAMRRFAGEDGEQYCWKVDGGDVIGVRNEVLGDDVNVSVTRAWVLRTVKDQLV